MADVEHDVELMRHKKGNDEADRLAVQGLKIHHAAKEAEEAITQWMDSLKTTVEIQA